MGYLPALDQCINNVFNIAGLVQCHLSSEKYKEAINIARNAHKTVGANARTLTVGTLYLL